MRIAVAIPCYKVTRHVLGVIEAIGPEVEAIYAVDDACPDGSGGLIEERCRDPRVRVLRHADNQGVGGAVVTAYKAALADGMDIVVKIDGDGQMNPALIGHFVRPIVRGKADYAKGNRFYRPESLRGMPLARLIGNAALSFINKLSTGYWPVMDPTNGYTAIHAAVLRRLPLDKLERRYFFESDMLYHLNIVRAVVHDVPMDAVYADEQSNLKVSRVLPEFLLKHARRFFKRYVYVYLLRDFNLGSVYSLFGALLCAAGLAFGLSRWVHGAVTGEPATSGTVMLAALPVLVGIQLLIAFLHHDVSHVPTEPLAADLDGEPESLS
ncbi:MAG: glycosyltransferase family 2 protein [Desulfovibrionaceae bacterium]|jgi:glycosyltransferase involved in cell wall biosynthesis|nr:glycosyltransferase family 2 protein [Desulfovibrionaceae bacterium]